MNLFSMFQVFWIEFDSISHNGLALGDVAAKRADFYRQDKSFFVRKMFRLSASLAMIA
jgi:hypothetical protein